MKKKTLLLSILSIVMCLSLVAGGTFALFTSESKVNVAVTSGTVSVTAEVNTLKYKTLTKDWTDFADGETSTNFDNIGGLATVNGGEVVLNKIVPGDALSFNVDVVNNSDVKVKYRTVVKNAEDSDKALFNALEISIDDANFNGIAATKWAELESSTNGEVVKTIAIKIELPETAEGADLMGKTCKFVVSVEAIQANAETTDDLEVDSASTLQAALENGGDVTLTEDIVLTESLVISENTNVNIDLAGKTLTAGDDGYAFQVSAGSTLTIGDSSTPAVSAYSRRTVIESGEIVGVVYSEGTLIINGGTFNAEEGESFVILNYSGDLTINGGTVNAGTSYPIYSWGEGSSLVINDVTVNATFGCVNSYGTGNTVEINGGTYNMTGVQGLTSHIAYLSNVDATINGGSFNKIGDINMSGTGGGGVCAIYGANVTINGGSFAGDYADLYNLGYTNANDRAVTISVKGGTFKYNPESFVAEGYTATQNKDGTYEVVIASNEALDSAIKAGETTIKLGSGNYIIPDSAKGKTNLTIVGNGVDTVVTTQDDGSYEGCDYSLDGATVTFEGITINTDSSTYTGYARLNATYNNCIINGTYTLYGKSEFNNCTFNVTDDVYNIWTWGASEVTFNDCTFNSDGKALLLYGTVETKCTLNYCTFYDNGGLTDLKAAIETGNDYGKAYELIVNNTTVYGYEINDKGISTGTTLWANKNSMSTDLLNVIVDGVEVY